MTACDITNVEFDNSKLVEFTVAEDEFIADIVSNSLNY